MKCRLCSALAPSNAGEFDIYRCNSLILKTLAGADIPPITGGAATDKFNGITVEPYPRVVLSPNFAPLLVDIKVSDGKRVREGSAKGNDL